MIASLVRLGMPRISIRVAMLVAVLPTVPMPVTRVLVSMAVMIVLASLMMDATVAKRVTGSVMRMAVSMSVVVVVPMIMTVVMTVVMTVIVSMIVVVPRPVIVPMMMPVLMMVSVIMTMIIIVVVAMIVMVVVPAPMIMPVTMMMVVVMVARFCLERIGHHQQIQIHHAARLPLLHVQHTLRDQLEHLGLEAQIRCMGKAHLRILTGQMPHLALDALDQRAGEQVERQHDDLRHAQLHLSLHGLFQPWEGDAGESDVHQLVITQLPEPARHLCHLTIGQTVARAPAEQDDARALGIGYIQRQHGPAKVALQDAQERLTRPQMRGIQEGDTRMTFLCRLDGERYVHPDMTGRIQDQRHDQHAIAALGSPVEAS